MWFYLGLNSCGNWAGQKTPTSQPLMLHTIFGISTEFRLSTLGIISCATGVLFKRPRKLGLCSTLAASKFQIFGRIFCPFLLGCFVRGQKQGLLSFFTGGSQGFLAQHRVTGAGETAQRVKGAAGKGARHQADNLEERENWLRLVVLWPHHMRAHIRPK